MSATVSNLPRAQVNPPLALTERPKPATSAGYARPTPSRRPVLRADTLFAMPKEPEDARLTGGTRSLERRLLALNLAKPKAVPAKDRETLSA